MSQTPEEAVAAGNELRQMPYGLARTQLAETLARRIEAEGPEEVLAYALYVLVESYVWGGEEAKAYVPFQRMVQLWDTRPELFDESDQHSFFWAFKWMVGGLKDHPSIPAAQIDATLADMERRYAVAGNGMDAVAFCAFSWANHRGDPEVERAFEAWVETPRDDYSQCEACSLGDEADYLWSTGRAEQAIRHILDVPPTTRWCATEPADMLALLALAQAELGQAEEAVTAHRKAGAALLTSDSDMAEARGRGFQLLARGGQLDRALEWLTRDAALLTGADTPRSRLRYQTEVLTGLSALGEEDLARGIELPDVPARTLGELRDWALEQARDLAGQFDARNGTDRFARTIEVVLTATAFPRALDLSVLRLEGDELVGAASVAGGAGLDAGAAVLTARVAAEGADTAEPAAPGEDDDADGAPGAEDDSYLAHLQRAERATGRGDLAVAAAAYVAGAKGAQEAGELLDAGFAYAEAARCAQELGDDEGAHRAYEAALLRLHAGGVDPELAVQVLVAWAPTAARPERAESFVEAANSLLERLAAIDPEQIPDERLRERRTRELSLRRAELDDSVARVIASVGQVGAWTMKDAADLASSAAELFAGGGDVASASHAFWAAGRMLREMTGAAELERAVFCLESAVEGFGIAGNRSARGEAANDLVALLRATGQDARAEEILRTL